MASLGCVEESKVHYDRQTDRQIDCTHTCTNGKMSVPVMVDGDRLIPRWQRGKRVARGQKYLDWLNM